MGHGETKSCYATGKCADKITNIWTQGVLATIGNDIEGKTAFNDITSIPDVS